MQSNREIMQQTLDYIKETYDFCVVMQQPKEREEQLMKSLEAALAQPEQSPVAWQFFDDGEWHYGTYLYDHRKNTEADGYPVRDLYTAPPKREWVGLTEGELIDIEDCNRGFWTNAAKIEQLLKDKNT